MAIKKINYSGNSKVIKRLCEVVNGLIDRGSVTTLAELTDVDLDNLTNEQIIKYNSTTEKWENADESGGGSATLAGLSDVDFSALADGQTIKYNATSQKWENVGGGGGGEIIDIFNGASTISLASYNGITLISSSVTDSVGTASMSEWSNGYEGFNIALQNLVVGKMYTLKFKFRVTSGAWFPNMQYRFGYMITSTNRSDYSNYTQWNENLDRDLNEHSHSVDFAATATTMYLSFNICGFSDSVTNYYTISELCVKTMGGSGSTVSYSQALSSGTETGEITIDGVVTKMYAPTPPTKVSDLQNDTGFITSTVSNLINYYTKTETYTKAEVDAAVAAVSTLNLLVVQTLPTQDISTSTIYLVPKQTAGTQNVYDEYIYIMSGGSGAWELIGDTEVDLSNYYTKTQVDNLIPTDFVSKVNGGTFEGDITIDNRYGAYGDSLLTLGNDIEFGEHGNSRGHIKLYGGLQGFTMITPADSTQRRDIELPNKNGTIALLDDLTTFVSDNPTFTEAQTRANIASGESFATILGKIKKWFTDLPSMFVSKSGDDMSGTLNMGQASNNVAINFRSNNADYYTTVSYQTSGNEACVFATKNQNVSWIFVNGEDSVTNHASDRWKSLIPALQIKKGCIAVGKLIGDNVDPTYKAEINGVAFSKGLVVEGRIYGTGDDEGLLIKPASNGWSGLILGSANSADRRIAFYLPNTQGGDAQIKYSPDGVNVYRITIPQKNGVFAVYQEYTLEGTTTTSGALLIPNALRTYNFIALQYANDSAVTVGFIFRREYSYLTCLTNSLTPVSETTVKVKIIYI